MIEAGILLASIHPIVQALEPLDTLAFDMKAGQSDDVRRGLGAGILLTTARFGEAVVAEEIAQLALATRALGSGVDRHQS